MPPGPDDLYQAAEELMAACVAAILTSPGGDIATRAIWPGLPAYDCVPALYVHAGGAAIGDTYPLQPPLQPMQRMVTTGQVPLIQLTITVLRCVPVIEEVQQSILMVPTSELDASAREVYGDLWAIWNHLKNEHRDGNLFQRPSGRREFIFDPAQPVLTSGGAGGWQIPIRVELGGYAP